ncbi:MAG TPA: hypothetical protein VMJ73_12105 [Rhizomicrobium sp.]|nr:hypothetical protein [Rhizomicrobium sp.]
MRLAYLVFLVGAALFLGIGRFTIPGHGLTGWPGFYEAVGHILLGMMIAVALYAIWCWISQALSVVFYAELPAWEWPSLTASTLAFWLVLGLTVLEIVMFKAQNG